MNVSEAVAARYSARAYLDTPVEPDRLRRILDRARQAPSGGNLQPWFVHVVTGRKLDELKAAVSAKQAESPRGEPPEFSIYPPGLNEPYRSRRFECGEDLYASIGIPRENRPARLVQFAKNLEGFGAPVMLFFSIDRCMGQPQWAHLGMYMQTVMLLAVEEGLHSCAQEAWSIFHSTISEFLNLPEERMFYCGMALGYADPEHPINRWRTRRAPLEDLVIFL